MRATLAEIARLCGVSRGTVDRVAHGRPHVRPEVRAKVQAALEENGYEPTRGRLVKTPLVTVAIVLPHWTDNYFAQQTYAGVNEAEHALNDPRFRVIVRELSTRSLEEYVTALDQLAALPVDGIILNAAQLPVIEMKINELAARGVAVVTYDADVPRSRRLCFIGQDIYRSGYIAAGLMARFMRPRDEVLIVTGSMDFESSRGRVDGFVRGLQAQGFPPDCYSIAETHERFDLTSETVRGALLRQPDLRDIYMANESVAGCVDGVRRAGCARAVRVICNDLTPSAKKYLQTGQIDFIIGQTFTQKAYKAVVTLHRYLCQGVAPERERLYTDSFIISRELL